MEPQKSDPAPLPSTLLAWGPIVLPVVLVAIASVFSFSQTRAGTPSVMIGMVGMSVALAVWGGRWAQREELLRDWITPRWGDISIALVFGVVTFAAAWGFLHFVAPAGTPREAWIARVYMQVGDPNALRGKLGFVFAGIALAAFAEEVLWRGFVIAQLEPLFGSRRAWIVSAFLYAGAHLPTAWALRDPVAGLNPVIVLGALGLGLLYGGAARVTGRLVPLILAHVLFDWAAIVMFRFWGPSL
jgi:uncharacterized protein